MQTSTNPLASPPLCSLLFYSPLPSPALPPSLQLKTSIKERRPFPSALFILLASQASQAIIIPLEVLGQSSQSTGQPAPALTFPCTPLAAHTPACLSLADHSSLCPSAPCLHVLLPHYSTHRFIIHPVFHPFIHTCVYTYIHICLPIYFPQGMKRV